MTASRFRFPFRFLAIAVFSAMALAGTARAAVSAGAVHGTVTGPDGKPLQGVPVILRNDITGFSADTRTDKDGRYQFFNVPFNPYELHIEIQGFKPAHRSIDVRSAVPKQVDVTLELSSVTEAVTVEAEPSTALETDTSVTHIDIDKSYIQRVPAIVASRAMEEILTSTPGFAKDENGRFHFQGAHSQAEFVIDGQTISDQTGVTFSNSLDPGIAQSLEVIYGNVPAEYGEKIGAVINLTTKSALGAPFKGEAHGGYGEFSTYEGGATIGTGSEHLGLLGSFAASGSDYFTDPVNFDNLNNKGDTQRAFLRFDWSTPDNSNAFRLSTILGRTARHVTNTFSQEENGQDKPVATYDQNYNLGWQNVLSTTSLVDATGFYRFTKFTLYPSDGDTPILSHSNRSLENYGISPTFTWASGIHEVKIGGVYKKFPITEFFSFGITDPGFNDPESDAYNPNIAAYDLTRGGAPFVFHGDRTGTYYAAYIQDNLRFKNLTANIGLRYDHNNLPATDVQLEPRVGLAYYIPSTGTVLRAAYNRILYTPEYENILLSSSEEAAKIVPPAVQDSRVLGGGVLIVHSEKQDYWTVGVQQALGSKVRLDGDYWERRTKNAGDQDQFENTGVLFPLAFESGDYSGWDVRLDVGSVAGFRGFVSAGHTHVIYVPPPAGGLFLDQEAVDAITGGPFLIDHDQKLQLQTGIFYDVADTGFWVGTNVRYDSGLVSGAAPEDLVGDPDNSFALPYLDANHAGTDLDPYRVKSRTIWDFSLGADLARYHIPVSIQAMVLNAFDKKGLYNILSVNGGTHVIPPRRFAVRAQVNF
jgi:hypothetical protein